MVLKPPVCVCMCVCPLQSGDTLRPEQDISSTDGVCSPESRSITGNTDTATGSARPVLTRQGKPVDWTKDLERKHPYLINLMKIGAHHS